jgi:hypothetical protein
MCWCGRWTGLPSTCRPASNRLVYAACAQISILCRHLLLTMRMSNVKSATANVNGAIFNVRSAVFAADGFGLRSRGGGVVKDGDVAEFWAGDLRAPILDAKGRVKDGAQFVVGDSRNRWGTRHESLA